MLRAFVFSLDLWYSVSFWSYTCVWKGHGCNSISFDILKLCLSHNFPLSEPGDWTRNVKARGCVRLKHSSAGCLVGLLTYLALPIDSISHSWFTGDRGTLFILAWGLTKKKRGNILKAGKKIFKATACRIRWFLVFCYTTRLVATLCPYKYSPDMTQQSCTQCKHRERKSVLTTLSSCCWWCYVRNVS